MRCRCKFRLATCLSGCHRETRSRAGLARQSNCCSAFLDLGGLVCAFSTLGIPLQLFEQTVYRKKSRSSKQTHDPRFSFLLSTSIDPVRRIEDHWSITSRLAYTILSGSSFEKRNRKKRKRIVSFVLFDSRRCQAFWTNHVRREKERKRRGRIRSGGQTAQPT